MNHNFEEKDPAAVEHKYGEYPIHDDQVVLDWESFKDKMNGNVDMNSVIQRFIWSPTGRAQMIRVVYYNPAYS